jgi:hypothetical protein
MAISINNRASGFRKWSEALEPKRIGEVCDGTDEGDGVAAPDVNQGAMTSDERAHRPWLVPGAGKL